VTEQVIERCLWSESNPDGAPMLCSDQAMFPVEVSWPTDDGMRTGSVPLCFRHALQADREGIAKR
jgi:hypothetical protein